VRAFADGLTLARACLGLPLLACLALGWSSAAWLLLMLGAASDALDGWLARRAGGGSVWGACLDPLADKLLVSAPFLWLLQQQCLPAVVVWLLLGRELVVSAWRGTDPAGAPASPAGKLKTVLQLTALLLLLWPPSWGGGEIATQLRGVGWWLVWPTLASSLLSAWFYLRPAPARLNQG